MEQKKPMDGSYLAIFILAIVFAIGTLFTKAAFGTVFWCFVAYQMHKRNNQLLSSVFKFITWFEIAIGAIALLFFASNTSMNGGWIFSMLILIGGIAAVMFALHIYFRNIALKESLIANDGSAVSSTSPIKTETSSTQAFTTNTQPTVDGDSCSSDSEAWETAYKEAEGEGRVIAVWAKCFADANGDEQRCKAQYIKQRAAEIISQRTQYYIAQENERIERENKERNAIERAKEEAAILERKRFQQQLADEAKDNPATFKALLFVPLILFAVFGLTFWIVGKAEDPNLSNERFEAKPSNSEVSSETRKIAEQSKSGAYPSYYASITNPKSSSEFVDNGGNANLTQLSQPDIDSLEAANRWWVNASGDQISIYTKNQTKSAIKQMLFDVSDAACNEDGKHYLLALELSKEIPPNTEAVIGGKLPFRFFRYVPSNKKNCGLIVRAYGTLPK